MVVLAAQPCTSRFYSRSVISYVAREPCIQHMLPQTWRRGQTIVAHAGGETSGARRHGVCSVSPEACGEQASVYQFSARLVCVHPTHHLGETAALLWTKHSTLSFFLLRQAGVVLTSTTSGSLTNIHTGESCAFFAAKEPAADRPERAART